MQELQEQHSPTPLGVVCVLYHTDSVVKVPLLTHVANQHELVQTGIELQDAGWIIVVTPCK